MAQYASSTSDLISLSDLWLPINPRRRTATEPDHHNPVTPADATPTEVPQVPAATQEQAPAITPNRPFSARFTNPAISDVNLDAIDSVYHLMRCGCPVCQRGGNGSDPGGRTNNTVSIGSYITAPPAASLQTLANYLRDGFWREFGTIPRRYNLGSSGPNPNKGVLYYNINGWNFDSDGNGSLDGDSNGLTSARRDLVREVLKLYEATMGIRFVETTSTDRRLIDFFFTDNASGAYAYAAGNSFGNGVQYSVINVASNWYSGISSLDSYTVQTFLHEIGHALGLGHQGLYNGNGSYATDAQFANDSWQVSMMSYFSQTANPPSGASDAFLQSPMSADWLALDDIYRPAGYGVSNAFRGDTVYGVGTNISATTSRIWNEFSTYAGRTAYTIVDSEGHDTLDVSNFSSHQSINLAPSQASSTTPSLSNIGGKIGNLSIAAGTFIEAAKGGNGSDTFYGNIKDNSFWGNAGDDVFVDSLGSDTYCGGSGNDWLHFSESIEIFNIAFSDDWLVFARPLGSSDADRAWKDIENITFNKIVYTFGQLINGLAPTTPSSLPAALLSTPNLVGNSINEGTNLSIAIATSNLPQGSTLYWQISGNGLNSSDFVDLSALEGRVTTDASGKATLSLNVRSDATTEGNETMEFSLFSDPERISKLADLSVTLIDISTTPVVSHLTLWGTTGSDVITGGGGNDQLAGVPSGGTRAAELGRGQVDTLTGGAGADLILLADGRGTLYNDGNNRNQGTGDYALIKDFNTAEDDRLQLRAGTQILYRNVTINGIANTEIFLGNGDNSFGAADELIARLQYTALAPGRGVFMVGNQTWTTYI